MNPTPGLPVPLPRKPERATPVYVMVRDPKPCQRCGELLHPMILHKCGVAVGVKE